MTETRWILCFNCGCLTLGSQWTYWQRDDEGEWRPSEQGDSDPMMRCPECRWEHVDDDGNPGIFEGTNAECYAEREAAIADESADWLQWWADEARDLADA